MTKTLFHRIGLLVLCLFVAATPALAQREGPARKQPIVLSATGLPAKAAPEALLPAGALLHIRLNNAQALLDDSSAMAMKFIPEKALPPPVLQAMEQPNPLLGLIGMMTAREPLSVEKLAAMSGIDPARPVTLSFYMANPTEGFILCVPVSELNALSAMLSGLLDYENVEKVALEGGSAFHIRSDLDLFVVCAEDTICVCGSPMLAQALLSAPPEARLNRSKLVSSVVAGHKGDNLLVVVDASPLKPLLPALKQYSTIPEEAIAEVRENLSPLGPAMNMRLRMQFGIRDIEQGMDYVEAVATAVYEGLFEYLYARASEFNGISLAFDIGAEFQTFRLSVYSDAITAAGAPKLLPLAEVGQAAAALPGSHNYLLFQGQRPKEAKSELVTDLMNRIREKMTQKQLPMDFYDTVRAAIDSYRSMQPLESKVPWTVTTRYIRPGGKRPDEYESLEAYLAALAKGVTTGAVVNLKAMPRQRDGFLEAHFKDQVDTTKLNDRVYRQFLDRAGFNQPFYTKTSRTLSQKMQGGVTKLVRENSYVVPWGLFGYNEHELINRTFTLYRNLDQYTLMYPGGSDPTVLVDFKTTPLPTAVKHILSSANVPADANRVELARTLHMVTSFADTLASIESLIHKDLEACRSAAQKILDTAGPNDDVLGKIADLDIPVSAVHLKLMRDKRQFYLTTPVGLTYPRPKILPEFVSLLDDYRKVSDSVGGAAIYKRSRDGQFELVVVQSTAAMGALVKTVGNNIAVRYIQNREGQQRLRDLFRTPLDEVSRRDPAVLSNPFWGLLTMRGAPLAAPQAADEF